MLELLAAGIDCRPVEHAGDLRVNITITEPDGTTTKLNSPGPQATPRLLEELQEALVRRATSADWIVLAGSLPPGTPPEWYAELVTALRGAGARVAVDTSDAPLKALVDALPDRRAPPDEAERRGARVVHRAPRRRARGRPAAAAEAAGELVSRGVESVLVTLGPHGAVLVNADGAWHASPPPTTVVSTVGAGDSSLFGYLLGDVTGRDPDQRLALAVAYGSAAAGLPGTTIPHPRQVQTELVHVTRLDLPPGD